MDLPIALVTSIGLLAAGIASVWLRPAQLGGRLEMAPWSILLACALTSGHVAGLLEIPAIAAIAALVASAYFANHPDAAPTTRGIAAAAAALLALALAFHAMPGFHNPKLISNARFSVDAAPFTEYANFDKACAGLIFLAFFCQRSHTIAQGVDALRRTLPMFLITPLVVFGLGMAIGYVSIDFKLPRDTPVFLVANLLFTVIAEESFFRGFLQEGLTRRLSRFRAGDATATLVSAVLFGAVHFGGGPRYVFLATLAGIGYAYAYKLVRSIEAPIGLHFCVNAVHFLAFTYPYHA